MRSWPRPHSRLHHSSGEHQPLVSFKKVPSGQFSTSTETHSQCSSSRARPRNSGQWSLPQPSSSGSLMHLHYTKSGVSPSPHCGMLGQTSFCGVVGTSLHMHFSKSGTLSLPHGGILGHTSLLGSPLNLVSTSSHWQVSKFGMKPFPHGGISKHIWCGSLSIFSPVFLSTKSFILSSLMSKCIETHSQRSKSGINPDPHAGMSLQTLLSGAPKF